MTDAHTETERRRDGESERKVSDDERRRDGGSERRDDHKKRRRSRSPSRDSDGHQPPYRDSWQAYPGFQYPMGSMDRGWGPGPAWGAPMAFPGSEWGYRPPGADRMSGLGDRLRDVDWRAQSLVAVQKHFYNENPTVQNRPWEEVEEWLRRHRVARFGAGGFRNPVLSFAEAGYPPWIECQFQQVDFQAPTVIQSVAWPLVLSGRDLVGISPTGVPSMVEGSA